MKIAFYSMVSYLYVTSFAFLKIASLINKKLSSRIGKVEEK